VSADKSKRLGRGLEALLGRHETPASTTAVAPADTPLRELTVAEIRPNPFQPRTDFKPEEIEELKASLAQNGLLQPITVRPASPGYELIAGERRLRAASALGWTKITCIVREIDDRSALTLALVENLQRSDLNPIEEAEGYQRLATEFQLSHEEIAKIVGKNRTTVVNSLRLLGLPDHVRLLVQNGSLSAGHGRAILGLPGEDARERAAQAALEQGFSVRAMENYVRALAAGGGTPTESVLEPAPPRQERWQNAELRRVENSLRTYLQTDVRVELIGPLSGNVTVRFYGVDDLNRLLERMMGSAHTDEAP
jgi:ParB family transcriptional regulator, chromosome partitioning protein